MPSDHLAKGISVRGTEIRDTEARHRYREKSDDRSRSAAALARVLVVDDNEDAASLLADVLIRKGCHARVALDAPAALTRQWKYDPTSRSWISASR
jgi:hypothetical protein